MREIPTPNYEYNVRQLADYYKNAMTDIRRQLERIDLLEFDRAQLTAIQSNIGDILKTLDKDAAKWVDDMLPIAVTDGVAGTLFAMELADTIEQAKQIVQFNRMNRDIIKTVVADTQSDLLQITRNVDRKVRNTIRQVTAEVLRNNLTKGINGTQALTSDIVKNLRKQLGDAVDTGIVDAANRRWKPNVYAEMVVRTKTSRAHTEATINEAVSREVVYGIISRHGATDACRHYEGKVVKLVASAEGNYPYVGDLPNREIFHPNCKHIISPVRRLDRLPPDLRELNNVSENNVQPTSGEKVNAKPIEQGKSKAIDQIAKDPSILDVKLNQNDGGEDKALKTILKEQGYDGKGNVVSKAKLDNFIKNGEREIFRGVTNAKFAEQFKDGDLFAGLGTYGNGTYTAYGSSAEAVAQSYAGKKGDIVRMSLKSDAKVIKYDELLGEMMDYEDMLAEKLAKTTTKKAREAIEAETLLIKDFGRFATLRGYDAIDVTGFEYLVVLNRTSLRIQRESHGGGF